jgi:hypothetical protein
MGHLQALEFAEGDLETGLTWHLLSNHYPPVPKSMVRVCMEAIDAMNEGDYYREIELPEGITYKGQTTAPAWDISNQHHLDAWIEYEEL